MTDDTINTWRINYGLVEWCPDDAAKWWAEHLDGKAPAGAVAALGLLLQERDALKRDAERYRWLRADMACDFGDPWVVTRRDASDNEPYALVGDELDAAIDAAMKESK